MAEPAITTEDWTAINAIVAKIYSSTPYPDLVEISHMLRNTVPFTRSITCLIGTQGDEVEFFSYKSDDMSEDEILAYRNKYIYHDYILWYCAVPEELSFRETDIINEPYYSNSIFMKEWLEPMGVHYGATINIARQGISFGNISMFRSWEEGDFTDRDMLILRTINTHLCICFGNLFPHGVQSSDFGSGKSALAAKYHLTDREAEIVNLIAAGVGRKELASKTFLSENTVKKHLNAIFKKTGSDGFSSLTRLVLANQPIIQREELGGDHRG